MSQRSRTIALWAVVAAMLVALAVPDVEAKPNKKRGKGKGTTKICSVVKGKRKCRRVAVFQGHGVARSELRVEPLAKPTGDLWVWSENLHEEVKVNIYRPDGEFDEDALAHLDEVFRCRRSHEVRAVDPKLYEHLSRISDHFGNKRIDLVSGFRFQERDSSRHFHASAMDIRIQGVTINEIYAYAQKLDGGGMGIGIYPHSGFVHVDVRAPDEPSYRWTDLSGGSGGKGRGRATKLAKRDVKNGRKQGRTVRVRKPVS